jgi:protoheme IX farnesyltransferase
MLPSVADMGKVTRQILYYTVALVLLSFALVPTAHLGLIYAVVAAGFGTAFIVRAAGLWRDPRPARAMKLFGFSITYLTVLFLAMGIDAVAHPW